MTMNKYYTPEDLFDISCNYREYVMASTTLSMKFIYLLQIVENMKCYELKLCKLATEIRIKSYDYKRAAAKAAATDTKLSLDILLHCSASYDDIDLEMSTASIEKKISLWNECLKKAIETKKQLPDSLTLPLSIMLSEKETLVNLENEQIVSELFDYADEIQAWLDIHFADEYDEYADDNKFMDIVQIMVDLEFMANRIEEISSNTENENSHLISN